MAHQFVVCYAVVTLELADVLVHLLDGLGQVQCYTDEDAHEQA
jgi:hypothetical protein